MSTQFVEMYHPNIPSTAVTPALVALQAVDEQYAHGWLLVDPAAPPPVVNTPYYTKAAADSRFERVGGGGAVASVVGQTGAVTGAQIAADPALRAAFVPKWKPSTAYALGEFVLNPSGQVVSANTAFTSGASYSASNWTVVAGGGGASLPPQTGNAGKFLTTDGTAAAWGSVTAGAAALVPTATKTAAYTAAAGDLAVMNVAGGATTLTLPTAPADKAQVGFLAVGATTAVPLTVNRGGSATIGPSGATSVTAPFANEVTVYQYDAANTRWLAVSNVKPLAALDVRYPSRADVTAQVVSASSTPVFRPIGSGAQPVTGTSPTNTGTLAGGTGVKRVLPAVPIKSFIVKWGNFTVGATEASTTTTTLSGATTAGATSLTTAASIAAGSRITIDTGSATEILTTGTPSGAGPFTIPITTAALFAHASGVTIAVDYGDITIQDAAVEYPSGTFTPLYFNGNQSTVMKAGGIVTSDEVALDIPANAPFWIRTFMTWPAGAFVALGGAPIANGQTFNLSATPADKTRLPGSVGGDTLGPTPIAVLGRVAPTVNALVIVGDSIATGQGDYPDIFRGYTGIATDGVVPAQKICGPSNRAMYDAANVTRWRKARLAPGTTCAYEAHGINDITAGNRTLAQLQADKLTIWSWLRSIPGIRNIYTGTLVPFTASTDGWMTAANQSISNATFETIRVGINDWMRDGAPVVSAANLTAVAVGTSGALRAGGTGHPLTGYIDIADAVEVNAAGAFTRNGGRWFVPGTIRTVTDAAMTSGTKVLTSATAAFTQADVGTVVAVTGAGAAGGLYVASISVVTNATTVTLAAASGASAGTTVSGATAKIGGGTPDGTHPGTPGHTAMAAALTAALPTLTA